MPFFLATAFDSELPEDGVQWANSGKPALEQVKANECGKEQKVFADKDRACFQSQ